MAGLFQVKLHGSVGGQGTNTWLNVFGYKSFLAVTDEVNALADAFVATVVPKVVDVVNDGYFAVLVEVFELNGVAYTNRVMSTQGTRVGNTEPVFIAWGFRYQRANQGERSGAKRIGPCTDTDIDNGVASGTVVAKLNTLANTFEAPLMEGIIETWFPVILHRPVPPATTWTSHDLSGVVFTGVTSQNTRKR